MLNVQEINQIVCKYFKISIKSFHSKTNKREIVQARQISMFFSRELTKESLGSIGSQIGGKNHATVLHACKTVANLVETDKIFKKDCEKIEKIIKNEESYKIDTSIKVTYEKSIQLYIDKFCLLNKIEFNYWVGGNVGYIAVFGDYFFNFSDIKYAVDHEINFEWISNWYDFNVYFGEKCSICLIDYIKLRKMSDNDFFNIDDFEKKILYSRIK